MIFLKIGIMNECGWPKVFLSFLYINQKEGRSKLDYKVVICYQNTNLQIILHVQIFL